MRGLQKPGGNTRTPAREVTAARDTAIDSTAATHNGRFAPSPSGELHFGSLAAALASFLQARSHHARWHLRVEDLDAPRRARGAVDAILRTLDTFGLYWDGSIIYQSDRCAAYESALETLTAGGHTFPCGCTRREALTGPWGAEGRIYAGTCRTGMKAGRRARSVRLRVPEQRIAFTDQVQARYSQALAREVGDFNLKRLDDTFAYQLAVVIDDDHQGVGEVVRGADLLDSTPRQIYLQRLLGLATPRYLHIPVLLDADGKKLSKREQSPGLPLNNPGSGLHRALQYLGQDPPRDLARSHPDEILAWAIANWRVRAIPAQASLPLG